MENMEKDSQEEKRKRLFTGLFDKFVQEVSHNLCDSGTRTDWFIQEYGRYTRGLLDTIATRVQEDRMAILNFRLSEFLEHHARQLELGPLDEIPYESICLGPNRLKRKKCSSSTENGTHALDRPASMGNRVPGIKRSSSMDKQVNPVKQEVGKIEVDVVKAPRLDVVNDSKQGGLSSLDSKDENSFVARPAFPSKASENGRSPGSASRTMSAAEPDTDSESVLSDESELEKVVADRPVKKPRVTKGGSRKQMDFKYAKRLQELILNGPQEKPRDYIVMLKRNFISENGTLPEDFPTDKKLTTKVHNLKHKFRDRISMQT